MSVESKAPLAAPMTAVVRFNASLQIKDVEAAHQSLLGAFAGGSAALDVGAIEVIDTAGIQLLLAAQSDADKQGIVCTFVGQSAAVLHALKILGLEGRLRLGPHRASHRVPADA